MRGGARPNAGRKKIDVKKKQVRISMTQDEYLKYKQLGGSKFLFKQMNNEAA